MREWTLVVEWRPDRVQKNPVFKSPTHWLSGGLLGFGLY